jgi:hypothetical protein
MMNDEGISEESLNEFLLAPLPKDSKMCPSPAQAANFQMKLKEQIIIVLFFLK